MKCPPELGRAKVRLDRLELYPTPVRIDRVRVFITPWFFRLPWFRRFDGHAAWGLILLRRPGLLFSDLLVHELCHVWQLQHHPVRVPLSYLRYGYTRNPYEAEARQAAASGERCPRCGADADDNWFDRVLCLCRGNGMMHTRCGGCGYALDGCPGDDDE